MNRPIGFNLLAGLVLVCAVNSALATPLTLSSAYTSAEAQDNPEEVYQVDYETSIPYSKDLSVVAGNSTSRTRFRRHSTVDGAVFGFLTTHQFGGDGQNDGVCCDYAVSSGSLTFVPLVDTTFAIEGLYTSLGAFMFVTQVVELLEDGARVFTDWTDSEGVSSESFVVGDIGDGNVNNWNVGSSTGVLTAGKEYEFSFFQEIAPDGSLVQDIAFGTAFGRICLAIGTAKCASNPIPSPSALALIVLGLFGFRLRSR